jgi:RNA polymerase sigma factor (sigma-70 family)
MNEELRKKINKLIILFRDDCESAEKKLYQRYFPRIQFYVLHNRWSTNIKDLDNAMMQCWMRLRNWFLGHQIEKSDRQVIYNTVRSVCNQIAVKDNREISHENAVSSIDEKLIAELPEMIQGNSVSWQSLTDNPENLTLQSNSRKILSRCLKRLSDRQQKAIDFRFFRDLNYREMGDLLGITRQSAFKNCKDTLSSLLNCLNEHGIYSVGDLI